MIDFARLYKRLALAVLSIATWSSAAFAQSGDDLYFDVVLRDTGSATIHADVHNNPGDKGEITVLAVHGMTEVGSMFEPLADAMFADAVLKTKVKRVVAIDMVAHGLSSPPTLDPPVMFGDLLLEDNVSVVIQSISYLAEIGMGPEMIMGHSMGGLAVQATQEALLAQDSSLRQLGVKKAVLIAAVPARGTQWTRLYPSDLSPFIYYDPSLGTIIDIPTAYCGGSGFRRLDLTYVDTRPSPATCIANDWMAIEPIMAIAELVGSYCYGDPDDPNSVGLCRPYVRQNAFAPGNGTALTVLAYSEDSLCPIVDQDDMYVYLTGKGLDEPESLYIPTVDYEAIHSMYISEPDVVAESLRTSFQ